MLANPSATVLLSASDLAAILAEVRGLREELEDLRASVAEERARDRRRIAALEAPSIQPMQQDRGELLRALLAANGGKMLAKDARHRMHISESRFSELLTSMEKEIEKRPYHLDRTQNIIILRS
jgi:hypothetical protein